MEVSFQRLGTVSDTRPRSPKAGAIKMLPQRLNQAGFLLLLSLVMKSAAAADSPDVSFTRDIRPILADRCFACHGPDTKSREADLRLDVATGDDGAHAAAIEPGSAEDSELWLRITSTDDDTRMPPPDAHVAPLNEHEQQLIRDWIDAGAPYETFWAFRKPEQPAVPDVTNDSWSELPIDRFVLHKLESKALQPTEDADPRTLIRRLTFDLTGLPPTRDEVHQFLRSIKPSSDDQTGEEAFTRAWSATIDNLLAKPQFGEHMARHWLDVVRYADTNGMHKDFFRNHTAYRDWVIRAFNQNLGYDDFVRYQLAGDLFESPANDQLIASGFHRLHLIIDRGTALPEESFTKNVLDRLSSVGTAFMGMTVHCAQCHDHKYDPLTQQDFYSLYAFFNNIDAEPETVARPENGLQPPFVSLADSQQRDMLESYDQQISELARDIAAAEAELKATKAESDQSVSGTDPDTNVVESQIRRIKELQEERKRIESRRREFNRTVPYAMVMKERSEVRPTHILVRGQYDAPGELVERNTPAFLPPLTKAGDVATRMDLANWFVDAEHPLTARVAVNRFWQQFFGVGLVKTSEDLGAQGDFPSHPELLDHLTVAFVQSEWDVKALVKQIVMSRTYRQSSVTSRENFKKDPDNRLLARGSRFRLDAEMIRDQILHTSGLLSLKMYGPSVKPPQPDGLWQAVTMTGQRFQADTGESIRRRSVYTFWKRAMPPPQMTILNAPTRASCIARRERTNTPSQALLLLNESEYLKAARELAIRTLRQDRDEQIDFMWETVTCQLPDADERATIESLISDLTEEYRSQSALADELCDGADFDEIFSEDVDPAEAKARLAAWTVVGNTLYNLDITKTRE